eukprot:Gb_01420 [translate_table: standard]
MDASQGEEKADPKSQSFQEGRKRQRNRILIMGLSSAALVAIIIICAVLVSVHFKSKQHRTVPAPYNEPSSNGPPPPIPAAPAPAAPTPAAPPRSAPVTTPSDTIIKACNRCMYRQLCISSLSSYPGGLQANLTELSVIGVELSLHEAKQVSEFVVDQSRRAVNEKEVAALKDCVDLFDDVLDQLNSSISELRSLNSGSMSDQIGNVQTWLSAALTDPSTCLDGLQDSSNGNLTSVMKQKTENVTELMSNALAIVNSLPTTVGGTPN